MVTHPAHSSGKVSGGCRGHNQRVPPILSKLRQCSDIGRDRGNPCTETFENAQPKCLSPSRRTEEHETLLGVIELPYFGNRYTAIQDQGAYKNGTRLKVAQTSQINDAVVAVGDFSVDSKTNQETQLKILESLAANALRTRMLGSAAFDLACLAEGSIDASITLDNKPWDMAAGVLIAREAGARVVDLDGSPHTLRSKFTLAGSPGLIEEIARLVERSHREVTTRETGDRSF